ncbi:outer membrane beta-barrel protein [Sphingobacterium chungjuense]|uniref:outer membrane beta-barrel protein n=1 Tax=Sphingobacterium chungjuense TaxID=2675553 RepID=UPI001F114E7A|nr:outer membrane beta-barrel protein [Sphingobacterium chungjuense]
MKTYLYLMIVSIAFGLSATTATQAQTQDSLITERDSSRKVNMNITLGKGDDEDDKSSKKKVKYPRIFGGLTFTRIDWGFSRPMDNGSFTFSEENQFLSHSRASNFGFDIAQFGVRLDDNIKIYTAAGFEWNYMRLTNNVILNQNQAPLTPTFVDRNEVNYTRNVLTSTYLRVPLAFEWRSNRSRGGDRVRIVAGPMFGILLKGSQRLRSDELGKQSFRDTYNLQSFQYGGHLRVGFGSFGVFTKYYMNDMFEQSPDQKGFKNFAFGLTLGF